MPYKLNQMFKGQVRWMRATGELFFLGKSRSLKNVVWSLYDAHGVQKWGRAGLSEEALRTLSRPHWFQPGLCVTHPTKRGAYQHVQPVLAVGHLFCQLSGLNAEEFIGEHEPCRLTRWQEDTYPPTL